MRIEFHKRSLQEIRDRLLTKEWEVSSLLGFIGFSILFVAIFVSVMCIHELACCEPNRLKNTYQIIDMIEMKDSYRGYPHINITTKNGDVYHIPDYVLRESIKEEIERIEAVDDQFVKIQYYAPWFSTVEIRGLSTKECVVIDAEESCRLSRIHSFQLLIVAVIAIICASVVILPLAMGIIQIKSRLGTDYVR